MHAWLGSQRVVGLALAYSARNSIDWPLPYAPASMNPQRSGSTARCPDAGDDLRSSKRASSLLEVADAGEVSDWWGWATSKTPRPAAGENARQSHAGAARQGSRPPSPMLLIFLRRSQVTELFQEQQIVSDL
jgi:hypothetical protein